MGNSATKEQRASHSHGRSHTHRLGTSPGHSPSSSSGQLPADQAAQEIYASRHGRGSRSELSTLLGLGSNHDRDTMTLEQRRESKQEREARKAERERIAREKERTRSMRDEHVDGGFLVTQGVYTGVEDYSKMVVRRLMIERRIAPFWRGLNDHSDSWTENQLIAAAKGLPIPAADEIPQQESPDPPPKNDSNLLVSEKTLQHLTVPIDSRSQSFNSDTSGNLSPISPSFQLPSSLTSGPSALRGRSKTLATVTHSSRSGPPQQDVQPQEAMILNQPNVNGQPLEACLYKDAVECPICFLYYPPYLNRTRCCDQAICSECFVQIKRPDPHPPEHADPSAHPPPPPPPSENPEADVELVSEPASCPFCKQPEFGVTFESPPFRRGLVYVSPPTQHSLHGEWNFSSAMSSSSSLQPTGTGGLQIGNAGERRRAASLSANAPTVITTDRVRPDWATKLQSARSHAARRAAAATALHTAAYLMGGRNGSPDSRAFAGFSRRGVLRRGTGDNGPGSSSAAQQLNMLAIMSERYSQAGGRAGGSNMGETSPTIAGPREGSRRNRVDDLEEMMMMEAIRLSLAAEEERTKREEKEAKKEAKKRAKEEKKEEKKARKSGVLGTGFNRSATNLTSPSSSDTIPSHVSDSSKGKAIDRPRPDPSSDQSPLVQTLSRSVPNESSISANPQAHLERSRAQLQPLTSVNADLPSPPHSPYGTSAFRPSHLRNLSNASSSSSSLADIIQSRSSQDGSPDASGVNISRGESATPAGGGAGLEPMFNFQSLAALIGHEEREGGEGREVSEKGDGNAKHVEDVEGGDDTREGIVHSIERRTDSSLGESVGTLKPEEFHDALESREAVEHVAPDTFAGSKGIEPETTEVGQVGKQASAS